MTVSEIVEFAVRPDGTRTRQFTVDGVNVQVRARDEDHEAVAASLVASLRAACVVAVPAPARATEWGDGQFDRIELAPGVCASLRITPAGDVVFTIPGGELTITAGACQLGLGLLEASRRAAQIRVTRDTYDRRTRRRPKR